MNRPGAASTEGTNSTTNDEQTDIVEATAAARRRVAAARGVLTRARRSGDTGAVSAAQQSLRERSDAYTALLRAAVTRRP